MTVYDMYRRTENLDREKSAVYAELFLKGIDTSCYIYPELALMCGQVSDYYGKRHLYTEGERFIQEDYRHRRRRPGNKG